jgi:hypothetical protein
MLKTFTLNAISHQQKTPESGLIYWNVTDENSRKRKITGITGLSQQGFIKTVTSQHRRELPLVEILSQHGEGDTFCIDFSLFNETFGYVPREIHPESQAAPPPANRLRDSLRALFQIPFR